MNILKINEKNINKIPIILLSIVIMIFFLVTEYIISTKITSVFSSVVDFPNFMLKITGFISVLGNIIKVLFIAFLLNTISNSFFNCESDENFLEILNGLLLGFVIVALNNLFTLMWFSSHSIALTEFLKQNGIENLKNFQLYNAIQIRNFIAYTLLFLWGTIITKNIKGISFKEASILFSVLTGGFLFIKLIIPA